MQFYKQILFPKDYSDHLIVTLIEGKNIIQKFGEDIIFLSTLECPISLGGCLITNYLNTDDSFEKAEINTSNFPAHMATDPNTSENYDSKVIRRLTTCPITKYALKNNLDIIIMVSHGNSERTHLLEICGTE